MLDRFKAPYLIAFCLILVAGIGFLDAGLSTEAKHKHCPDIVEQPLWITDVQFDLPPSASDESFVAGSTPFVTYGDLVQVEFTIENRVPDKCEEVYESQQAEGEPNPRDVEVYRWHWNESKNWVQPDSVGPGTGNVCDGLGEINATCTVRDFVLVDRDDLRKVDFFDEDDGGELPLNYVAGDKLGSQWRPFVGTERVIVVDQRPDLRGLDIAPLSDDPLVTGYWTYEDVQAAVSIDNAGNYSTWDPNAGDWFWGRSSYDGDNDLEPDQRNPTNAQAESLYAPTDPTLPTCWKTGKPADPEDSGKFGIPPPGYASANTNANLPACSYKRGASYETPLTYELRRNETDTLQQTGTVDTDWGIANEDKDDAIPPHEHPVPREASHTTAAWDTDRHRAYLFSGTNTDRILTYNPYHEDHDHADAIAYGPTINIDGLEHADAAWSDGRVYLAGTPDSRFVVEYDPVTDQLASNWDMPLEAYDECKDGHDGTRIGSNVISHAGSIWVIGGTCPEGGPVNQIAEFKPDSRSIHEDDDGNWAEDLRAYAAAALADDDNTAYLFGGFSGNGGAETTILEISDLDSDPDSDPQVGELDGFDVGLANATATWDPEKEVAYVFGGEFEPAIDTPNEIQICRTGGESPTNVEREDFYLKEVSSDHPKVKAGDIRLDGLTSRLPSGSIVQDDDRDEGDSLVCETGMVAEAGDLLYIGHREDGSEEEEISLEPNDGGSNDEENWWIRLSSTEDHEAGSVVRRADEDLGEDEAKIIVGDISDDFGVYHADLEESDVSIHDWAFLSTNDEGIGSVPSVGDIHLTNNVRPFGTVVTEDTLYSNDRVYEFNPEEGNPEVSLVEYEDDDGVSHLLRLSFDDDDEDAAYTQDRAGAVAFFDDDPPKREVEDPDDDEPETESRLPRAYILGGFNETDARSDVLTFTPHYLDPTNRERDDHQHEHLPIRLEDPLPRHPRHELVTLFDTVYTAGTYNVTVDVGLEKDVWIQADTNTSNNTAVGEVDVHGLNLTLEHPIVEPKDATGGVPCGLTKEEPCDPGTPIHVQASYRQAGDEFLDGSEYDHLRERSWKAGLFLNGLPVDQASDGRMVTQSFSQVPTFGATQDGEDLWQPPLTIETDGTGGLQVVKIALDHPDLYNHPSSDVKQLGKIAETVEINDCPQDDQPTSNVYCATFFYQDEDPPEIQDVWIEPDHDPDQDAALVYEGEHITINAIVDDDSPDTVQATLTAPNGTTDTIELTREHAGTIEFNHTLQLVGELGEYDVSLYAEDVYERNDTLEDAATINLTPQPATIDVHRFLLNGNNALTDGNATYQGSASEPDNWLRVEVEHDDTGRDDPWDPDGRTLNITPPDGDDAQELPMHVYTVCTLYNTATDEEEGTAEGDQCDEDQQDPHIEVQDERPRYYVDTRCEGESHEPDAGDCQDAPPSTREAWDNATLDWIGTFHANATVRDAFDRVHEEEHVLELTSPHGPPTLENETADPTTLEPGEATTVEAYAADQLRVERVTLDVVKPDGTTERLDLDLDPDEAEDAETLNGTYEASFLAGTNGELDQAGIYQATIVAENFAGDTNQTEMAPLEVLDPQPPKIDAFESIPNDVQEVNGNVTWEATITDDTQIKPPQLTVQLPATGTIERVLTYNDTRNVHELDPPLEASPADEGTWTYELTAEDYAGNAATANGTLEVVENREPQALDWSPDVRDDSGTAWGAPDAIVSVDVVDYSHGVNESTIEVTLDDDPVDVSLEETNHGYHVQTPLPENLTHGDTVTVTITAADHSDPPLVAENLTHTFHVDENAPDTALDPDPHLEQDGQTLVGLVSQMRLDANDLGAGTSHVDLRIQGPSGHLHTLEGDDAITWSFKDLPSELRTHGPYTLTATAEDGVGNQDATTHEVFLDAAAPTISLLPTPGQPPEVVSASIEDDSRVEDAMLVYEVDGDEETLELEPTSEGIWQATVPEQPEGTLVTYRVQATDLFQNKDESPEITFEAGHAVPEIEILAPEDSAILEGTVPVSWSAQAPGAEEGQAQVSWLYRAEGQAEFAAIPGLQFLPLDGPEDVNTTRLPNGPIVLKAVVDDGQALAEDEVEAFVNNPSPVIGTPAFESADVEDGVPVVDAGALARVSVQFDAPVTAAWANLTQDGKTIASAVLSTAAEDNVWTGDLETPDEEGSYAMVVTGVEEDGTRHVSSMHDVEVGSTGGGFLGIPSMWAVLTALTMACVAMGSYGLRRRWV